MDDMHGLTRTTVIGLKGLFVGLAAISVALRLIANWKYNRKLLVDDCECFFFFDKSFFFKALWTLLTYLLVTKLDISITAIPFLIAVAILSDAAGNGMLHLKEKILNISCLSTAS